MSRHAAPRRVMPCRAMPRHAMPCHAALLGALPPCIPHPNPAVPNPNPLPPSLPPSLAPQARLSTCACGPRALQRQATAAGRRRTPGGQYCVSWMGLACLPGPAGALSRVGQPIVPGLRARRVLLGCHNCALLRSALVAPPRSVWRFTWAPRREEPHEPRMALHGSQGSSPWPRLRTSPQLAGGSQ